MTGANRGVLRVVGWVVAGVLAVATAAGVGMAFAGSSGLGQAVGEGAFAPATPTPSGSAAPDRPERRGKPGWFPRGRFGAGIGRGMLHGEFVVKGEDGKIVTMVTQHGNVTAVSGNSVTLRSEDGFTGTYAVGSDTRVRVGGGPGAISGVKAGNEAWVVAKKSGDTSTATLLVAVS
jgi:hypothetical protein